MRAELAAACVPKAIGRKHGALNRTRLAAGKEHPEAMYTKQGLRGCSRLLQGGPKALKADPASRRYPRRQCISGSRDPCISARALRRRWKRLQEMPDSRRFKSQPNVSQPWALWQRKLEQPETRIQGPSVRPGAHSRREADLRRTTPRAAKWSRGKGCVSSQRTRRISVDANRREAKDTRIPSLPGQGRENLSRRRTKQGPCIQ